MRELQEFLPALRVRGRELLPSQLRALPEAANKAPQPGRHVREVRAEKALRKKMRPEAWRRGAQQVNPRQDDKAILARWKRGCVGACAM